LEHQLLCGFHAERGSLSAAAQGVQTEIRASSGVVRLTDACALRRGADLSEEVSLGRGELLRLVEILDGRLDLKIEVMPRGGATAQPASGGLRLHCNVASRPELRLTSSSSIRGLAEKLELDAGQHLWVMLAWGERAGRVPDLDPREIMANTVEAWRRWSTNVD
jgi:hypothetical protein